MFDYFKNRKERIAREAEEKAQRHERLRHESEIELKARKREMVNTYCPIRGDRCSDECVHFCEGRIIVFPDYPLNDGIYIRLIDPSCKLWK